MSQVEETFKVLLIADKESYVSPPKGWHELKFVISGLGKAERGVLLQYDPKLWIHSPDHEGIEVFRNLKMSLWLKPA